MSHSETINLKEYNINCDLVYRNLTPEKLYEFGKVHGAKEAASGALVIYSGEKTGRSPKDKRVVKNPESENDIWWGSVNIPFTNESFAKNKETAISNLSKEKELFVFDGFAGANEKYRISIRVICTEPYHALFMHNMLIRPTEDELNNFKPDFVIYNGGAYSADTSVEGVETTTSVALSFEANEMVILGTRYAGEMKKGVFTLINYLMPKKGKLSMHCSANEGEEGVSVFFGLSGTGKTTLSADPKRHLIGDDEHVWTEDGVFNVEGGCYAKCINLSREQEPEIFDAIRFGTVLENVILDEQNNPKYEDGTLTENTRAAYPIDFIPNSKIPSVGGTPKNVIFLTCDAFGILPPVSKLSPFQASYHFISGYTAKVAGTEMGVTEPQASFSACFGAPFMVWHPNKYATLLAEELEKSQANAWLINTGWVGGAYGVGERIKLKYTRAIIDAIHSGELEKAPSKRTVGFNLEFPMVCSGVPDDILFPKNSWQDKDAYEKQKLELANLFIENFKKFESGVSAEIRAAGPQI